MAHHQLLTAGLLSCAVLLASCTPVVRNDPDSGPSEALQQGPNGALQIDIVLDHDEVRIGEPITGSVKVKNIGSRRIEVDKLGLPREQLLESDRRPVEWLPSKVFICGGIQRPTTPLVLEPFASHTYRFSWNTDPLSDVSSARLQDGQYVVSHPDLLAKNGIATVVHEARLTAIASPENPIGSRIIECAAGTARLTVFREDGRIESFDLSSGKLVSAASVPDYVPDSFWQRNIVFSADACRMAVLRQLPPDSPNNPLRINWYSPMEIMVFHFESDHANSERFTFRSSEAKQRPAFLRAFDAGDYRLLAVTDDRRSTVWVDAATGQFTDTDISAHERLSPRSDYAIDEENATILVRPINGGFPLKLEGPAPMSRTCLPGKAGLYVAGGVAQRTSYHPYDGGLRREFATGSMRPVCESPDGRRFVVQSQSNYEFAYRKKAGNVEIWDNQAGKKLFDLNDGQQRRVMFGGSPPVLISAIVRPGGDSVTWLSSTFELRNPSTGVLLATIDTSGTPEKPRRD